LISAEGPWIARFFLLLFVFLLTCPKTALAVEAGGVDARVLAEFSQGLKYPTDLAVDENSRAYVVDGLNQRIVVLDPQANLLREIRHTGFKNPVGIDLFRDRLYVSDPEAGTLFVFSLEGDFVRSISLPIGCDPVDVLALDDKIVISDNDNHRLLFLSYKGGLLKAIGRDADKIQPMRSVKGVTLPAGRGGDRVAEFKYPGILTRGEKNFLVVDVLNGRVQAFSHLGNFDRMIGQFGTDGEALYRPKGACACFRGEGTLVSDSYSGQIHVYNEFAESQGFIQLNGKPWSLQGPTAVQCCGDSWWVVDCRDSRVVRFEVQ
jgi:hypothetical protein